MGCMMVVVTAVLDGFGADGDVDSGQGWPGERLAGWGSSMRTAAEF